MAESRCYCWNPACGWSGPDLEADWKHVQFVRDGSVIAESINKAAFCPKCGGSLYDEAETERAAIREYDGDMTREEAERKVEGDDSL